MHEKRSNYEAQEKLLNFFFKNALFYVDEKQSRRKVFWFSSLSSSYAAQCDAFNAIYVTDYVFCMHFNTQNENIMFGYTFFIYKNFATLIWFHVSNSQFSRLFTQIVYAYFNRMEMLRESYWKVFMKQIRSIWLVTIFFS